MPQLMVQDGEKLGRRKAMAGCTSFITCCTQLLLPYPPFLSSFSCLPSQLLSLHLYYVFLTLLIFILFMLILTIILKYCFSLHGVKARNLDPQSQQWRAHHSPTQCLRETPWPYWPDSNSLPRDGTYCTCFICWHAHLILSALIQISTIDLYDL